MGSFAAAARRLGLTPAAVGKNVARLEANLGVRLFLRSTRRLHLTEAGERFLAEVSGGLASIQGALANLASSRGQPAGTLKVSMGMAFGRDYILPHLSDFLLRYPAIVPDWHFDNRAVDLIGEGFDAAIGGGFELPHGAIARQLAPAHRVLLASPQYLARHAAIDRPEDLSRHDGILIRSPQTGRARSWPLRTRDERHATFELTRRVIVNDPEAACHAALQGLGVTLVSTVHALPYLQRGSLERVLPDWYVDTGSLSLYFSAQKQLPAKTRVFIDFIIERFREHRWAERFDARRQP